MTTKIAVFKGKKVRKTIHKNEWWFSIIDIIEALTGTERSRKYWNDLKKRLINEGYFEVSEKIGQLKLLAIDGKKYLTDCANTETIFRIIQTIPSPKAEPFKRWLARVGYERVQEIEDPELAAKRTRAIYKAKGYSDVWIEKRMRGIEIRETLTDEWQKRGAKEQREYEILTAEISKATFGMTPSQYKKFKGLKRENLRDHMEDLELILTMLGEATTTKITKDRNSKGFVPLKQDAKEGGEVAGSTRKDIEKRTGKRVSSRTNFLKLPQNKKLLKNK
ncbi:MAG: Bro-N domain-containing protein [Candidatus Omnitrophica bacterium]|nr:Bro-N domain-containing protein [Candidatus Omnitrophota bacterium]MBU0878630.1 Bro-N domain-containing protein [Candidatus Omnitrophota bacterium]MBU0897328.1 Bro-N domain-containing protein [Candidatus Omnitrophota bacterium]MBU1133685.1 Bro-N domain-containing protein [Candidatus Omnitrophota bacterium]MBU1810316.1 Bro-N domain-containing protein [Candidatus Omnitrophota bacterium]